MTQKNDLTQKLTPTNLYLVLVFQADWSWFLAVVAQKHKKYENY